MPHKKNNNFIERRHYKLLKNLTFKVKGISYGNKIKISGILFKSFRNEEESFSLAEKIIEMYIKSVINKQVHKNEIQSDNYLR